MNIAIVSFTRCGALLAQRIIPMLRQQGHRAQGYATAKFSDQYGLIGIDTDIRSWTGARFTESEAIIFIGASGIAVRAIAPWVQQKDADPAIVVIDEKATFVIPILSGHIGGANKLARELSAELCATPVITTSSDVNGKFAVDEWAVNHELHIENLNEVKYITAGILEGREIGLNSILAVEGSLPEGIVMRNHGELGICISYDTEKKPFEHTLNLTPKNIVAGVGCRKGISDTAVENSILTELQKAHLPISSLQKLCSVELKKDETALLAFSRKYNIPFQTYSAEELNDTDGNYPSSEFVKKTTGTDNVCQRAAAKASENGEIVSAKTIYDGVTVSLARSHRRITF